MYKTLNVQRAMLGLRIINILTTIINKNILEFQKLKNKMALSHVTMLVLLIFK